MACTTAEYDALFAELQALAVKHQTLVDTFNAYLATITNPPTPFSVTTLNADVANLQLITAGQYTSGPLAGNSIALRPGIMDMKSDGPTYIQWSTSLGVNIGLFTMDQTFLQITSQDKPGNLLDVPLMNLDMITGQATFRDLNLSLLPTSDVGLVAGDVWNNAGVLNIVS